MKNNQEMERASALTEMAFHQSIARQMLQIGRGFSSVENLDHPYRILDLTPVFHIGFNEFNLNRTSNEKLKYWGGFYHPFMMMGMPDIGGKNTIHVDESFEGYYVLVIKSKLDAWAIGPSYAVYNIIAWTPKKDKDHFIQAGYRMFWAVAMAMDWVDANEFYSDIYNKESNWLGEWNPTGRAKSVLASCRKTKFDDQIELQKTLKAAPAYLKEHIIKNSTLEE